jgi:hypothetical protein
MVFIMSVNEYYDLIIATINHMHANTTENIQFDTIYTLNYILSVKNYHDIVNLAYDIIKDELVHFDHMKQKKYFDMIGDIFMYPIMMNVIKSHTCLYCKNEIKHNKLHCEDHTINFSYLDDIKTFKKFKNEYCYEGKLWLDNYC